MTRLKKTSPTSKSNEPSPFWSKLAKISSATSWHTSAVQSLLTSTLRRTCDHFRSFLLETLQLDLDQLISSFCFTSLSRVQLVFTRPSRHVASTIDPPAWSPLWLSFHHRPAKVKRCKELVHASFKSFIFRCGEIRELGTSELSVFASNTSWAVHTKKRPHTSGIQYKRTRKRQRSE